MTQVPAGAESGALCRRIIRSADRATLATIAVSGDGGANGPWPYASLVLAACDCDASPLLLLSDLADHTKNFRADSRVSLLYDGTAGLGDPLTGPRLTVQGRAGVVEDTRMLKRYLRRHPSAERYVGFSDFHLFRVQPVRAHLVAGFGRIEWLDAADVVLEFETCHALAMAEADALASWNESHADLFDICARGLLRQRGKGWRAVGLDPEGIDIRRDGKPTRIEFRSPAATAEEALAELRQRVGTG